MMVLWNHDKWQYRLQTGCTVFLCVLAVDLAPRGFDRALMLGVIFSVFSCGYLTHKRMIVKLLEKDKP